MLNNIKDYLPLLNSVIITDLLFMIFIALGLINSKVLKDWYNKYTLSATTLSVMMVAGFEFIKVTSIPSSRSERAA